MQILQLFLVPLVNHLASLFMAYHVWILCVMTSKHRLFFYVSFWFHLVLPMNFNNIKTTLILSPFFWFPRRCIFQKMSILSIYQHDKIMTWLSFWWLLLISFFFSFNSNGIVSLPTNFHFILDFFHALDENYSLYDLGPSTGSFLFLRNTAICNSCWSLLVAIDCHCCQSLLLTVITKFDCKHKPIWWL